MYYNPYLQPKDQLAKQQVAIHNAVKQIVTGKADRMLVLLERCVTQCPRAITITADRAYLNPHHPFYDLIVAYHYFDVKLFDALFNNSMYDQQKNQVKLLSPYCQLLLQCDVFINIRESIELAKEVNGLLSINLFALEDIYWLLDALKIGSMKPAFKTAVSQYNHDTGYTDNLREYSHYVKKLFNTYSRLLVIRVDLSYQRNIPVTYEQFRTDVDYLLNIIPSNPAFKDLVGYIWKLEHGNDKGYHVHLLLFYDGAKRWSDYYIAQQIGEFWQNNITLEKGLYFNCNTKEQKEQYHYCYLGMVHRSEQQKIDWIIAQGVSYLVKTDEYLRLTKLDRRRVLGKGVIKSKK